MSLQVCSLNSGSNGNCYYIGNQNEAILVDAGLSCREIEKRAASRGLDLSKVKALFISHEHSDHISAVETLSSKYGIPVHVTTRTYSYSGLKVDQSLIRNFTSGNSVQVGDLEVHCFLKLHDAADPHSFLIRCGGTTVGVFTDIGFACNNVMKAMKHCDAAFLEANYDEFMLETGHYPRRLKQRIRGGKGHLSNRQAFDLFQTCGESVKHIFLSHLSEHNNNPQKALDVFVAYAKSHHVSIASRYEASEVFEIIGRGGAATSGFAPEIPAVQMALF